MKRQSQPLAFTWTPAFPSVPTTSPLAQSTFLTTKTPFNASTFTIRFPCINLPSYSSFSSFSSFSSSSRKVTITANFHLKPKEALAHIYQLEEMEDKDTAISALRLLKDGTVEFGATSGPKFEEASGEWGIDHLTGKFVLIMKRKFADAGKFAFEVERTLIGAVPPEGDSEVVTIDGVVRMNEADVGYFSMIRAEDDLPNVEGTHFNK